MEQKSNGGFRVNKSINQLVGEITSLAVMITSNTNADVFIDYSAHCDSLEIRIFKDGWENHCGPDIEEDAYTKIGPRRNEENVIKKQQEIEKQLVRIARKGKINFSELPYELVQVKAYRLVGGRKNA